MLFKIISVHNKSPDWVNLALADYQARFSRHYAIKLCDLPCAKKQGNIEQKKALEAAKILGEIQPNSYTILLDESGKNYTTHDLYQLTTTAMQNYSIINLIIGGPDGVHQTCYAQANIIWSISKITLPHNLVRIIVIEQLFRIYSIINKHPYHRD